MIELTVIYYKTTQPALTRIKYFIFLYKKISKIIDAVILPIWRESTFIWTSILPKEFLIFLILYINHFLKRRKILRTLSIEPNNKVAAPPNMPKLSISLKAFSAKSQKSWLP
jgi:hypothetical protein